MICGYTVYSQTNLVMYTCDCSIFLTESPFGRVTIVTIHGPNHCLTDQRNVERNFTGYGSWLGFHYLILDQCIVMRKWDAVFSSFLGLCDQFMNVGGEMLSPSLGLYYLLAGLCRILGKMYAVLLLWVWETFVVLLVWVWASTTCFQAFAGC